MVHRRRVVWWWQVYGRHTKVRSHSRTKVSQVENHKKYMSKPLHLSESFSCDLAEIRHIRFQNATFHLKLINYMEVSSRFEDQGMMIFEGSKNAQQMVLRLKSWVKCYAFFYKSKMLCKFPEKNDRNLSGAWGTISLIPLEVGSQQLISDLILWTARSFVQMEVIVFHQYYILLFFVIISRFTSHCLDLRLCNKASYPIHYGWELFLLFTLLRRG
jgi:hypothetical protein